MSDANDRRIKDLEAQGETGETCGELHGRNCAQTDALSSDQIDSTIADRKVAGKPTGKLEAARRARG